MGVQIVEIAGEKMAVLPVADYERLVDQAEDRVDNDAAAAAEQRRLSGEEYLPSEFLDRMLSGESPLRVWREYRGLTQGQLGSAVGLKTATHVSDLESGKRKGSFELWSKLARALNISIEDLQSS